MNPGTKDARELIAFYLDAGVDALIGEEPVDRMSGETTLAVRTEGERPDRAAVQVEGASPKPRALLDPTPRPRAPIPAPAVPEAAAMAARDAAKNAKTSRRVARAP